jgi:hypothetical protein
MIARLLYHAGGGGELIDNTTNIDNTINNRLRVGKCNALSGNTAAGHPAEFRRQESGMRLRRLTFKQQGGDLIDNQEEDLLPRELSLLLA